MHWFMDIINMHYNAQDKLFLWSSKIICSKTDSEEHKWVR